MTIKEKIEIKSDRLGFMSKDRVIKASNEYYPLWLWEIARWLAIEHKICVYVEGVNVNGKHEYYSCLTCSILSEDYEDTDTLPEECFEDFDLAFEDAVLSGLERLRLIKKNG